MADTDKIIKPTQQQIADFTHLHCHTQYSLLDGASKISTMLEKAKNDGMRAAAITDHGNMFGVFEFVKEAKKRDLIPVVGCEFYLVEDRHKKQFSKQNKDQRFHQLLLAKNPEGYKNLMKLCSLGYTEGLYSKWPRIDKELILKYKEGLIATTCCIGAEVPQAIINKGEEEGEKVFKWWLDLFGDDYYVELQRHHIDNIDDTGISQEHVNQVLLKWAAKYNVRAIATNDSHYIDQVDSNAHDILLCVNTGDLQQTRERFRFPNDEFYFKSQAEMKALFSDVPDAISNTEEIVDKITPPEIVRDILLPNYTLPQGFTTEDDFLKHLSFEGARQHYGELTTEITERLDYELKVIREMGFAGYFLIVQDFIAAAKDLDVAVGPGRGSAAGSAVAYCTGITNIDPIGYNLLFERFLNPERVSMPDIDIDFDDHGRQKVIDYVVDKYGQNQVAQIVTFGTMAARSSIRDVGRVLDLPLPEADKLAKLVPSGPGVKLAQAVDEVNELKEIKAATDLQGDTLRLAASLEGSVRHTGLHAAGVIIAPDDLTKYIPVCTSKDADLWVTQFEGKYVEDAGMLKMDFLGLKTLSIIKDAIANIEERHGNKIDPDEIPLDDELTYELFQEGRTIGIFQFESAGMQKYLKELKPTNIEDLIAMNALYRPGPMDYIPTFVNRKHGREEVKYPHEKLEELLKPTYGIMVYQEQIMQTAQIIGGFSLGSADILRRAMGKKKMEIMDQQQVLFVKGAAERGVDEAKANEIFEVMKEFAKYGFNRSHSAAYSVLAFQTAYLKAHYPAEYMASVLTHNMNDIKSLNFFLKECRNLKVPVLGPDVNESGVQFAVNRKGEIRFALSAVKGVGAAAVEGLVEERRENGEYKSVFDLTRRVNLRAVNRKCLECLVKAGALDGFGDVHRAQYFHTKPGDQYNLIENAVKHGNAYQQTKESHQNSLFGDLDQTVETKDPDITQCEPWTLPRLLKEEKDVTGIYLSGHPLDKYRLDLESFCSCNLVDLPKYKNQQVSIGGMSNQVSHRISKRGNHFASFSLEDYSGSVDLFLFGEDYLRFKHMLEAEGIPLYITGKYQLRYKSDDEYELKISKIQLLDTVREEKAKRINIVMSLSDLNDDMIRQLEEICQEFPGKYQLGVQVRDEMAHYAITFNSMKYRVDITEKLVDRLTGELQLAYSLA